MIQDGPRSQMNAQERQTSPPEALAARLSGHTALYAAGFGTTLLLGLASVAVLTRLLGIGEYGELAVLLIFSALLTVVFNLPALQGTLMWVFGAAEEGDGDERGSQAPVQLKRQALGTGLVITALIAALGTAAAVAAAPSLSDILLGDRDHAAAVRWAAVSGGLGAVWRLISNVLRYEGRPVGFIVLSNARPVLVVAVAIPLVAGGGGVVGAMAGTAIGTALAVLVGLVVTRRSYAPALDTSQLRGLLGRGLPLVPVVVAFWVVQNVDLYLVSVYVSEAEAAIYRVASRLANVISYFVSAFLMAWMPLSQTALYAAVSRTVGARSASATISTYFLLACMWLLLALVVLGDALVKIAPEEYSEAADLLPLLGLGFVAYGSFVVLYRAGSFPRKRAAYVLLATVSAACFLATALVATPAWGSMGAALAPVVGFAVGVAGMLVLSQRGPHPIPFEYRRLLAGLLVAGVILALGRLTSNLAGDAGLVLEIAALMLFPVLLLAARVVTRAELRQLLRLMRPRRTGRPDDRFESALGGLDAGDRRLLEALVGDGVAPRALAAESGRSESSILSDLVAALRAVARTDPVTPADPAIGRYLLSGGSPAERAAEARRLWTEGTVDPYELDVLENCVRRLGRLPRSAWHDAGANVPNPEVSTRR